jgi:hypothetical protein
MLDIKGVLPTRKYLVVHGTEQWAEYSHKEETRGSQTAETKMPKQNAET